MATYLTGSNKYIPQIQPFQPDLNFYKTVLDTKTAQYEAGYDRVNSIYGTLLNSPLTRQDTSTMRNDFFSKANNEIQRLAGVDLSIEDNQSAAFQVFKPLTTNKLFAKDVNFTKDLYNEYDRSEFFRNCINEKECGGKYWQGGVDYLQYKAQDFAQADENTAMSMESPKYVPFVNVTGDAVDFAIKSKLEMQTMSSDGRYIYTTTNGTPMEAPLYNYFLAKYGNDQKVADMYNVSAYLQRKSYGQEKASEFGSQNAAEADYIRQVIDAENKANRESKIATQQTKETINAKKTVVEDYIKKSGVDPEQDSGLIEYYRRLNDDEQIADQADSFYKESLDITSPTSIEGLSQTALANRADAILARSLLSKDLANAASSYAQLTQKQDAKADPIYLENLRFSHDVSLKSMEIENQWKKAAYDYANDLEKKLFESRLKTDITPGKYEKALGFLDSALGKSLGAVSWLTNNEDDTYAESTGNKTPEQLRYEAELHANALKEKAVKENELEFYIHQLRGHTSQEVWNSMGEEKLKTLGLVDKNQLLFLDSQDQQIAEAKKLFEAKQKGESLSQTDLLRANAYAMGWGADIDSYSKNYNSYGPFKQAVDKTTATATSTTTGAAPQQTQTSSGQTATASSDSTAVAQTNAPVASDSTVVTQNNIPAATADTTANAQTTSPVSTQIPTDTTAVASTDTISPQDRYANPNQNFAPQQIDALAGIKTQEDVDALNAYANSSLLEKAMNPRALEFTKALAALQDPNSVESIVRGAENYAQYTLGADSLTTSLKNVLRSNARAYLVEPETQKTSVLGAIMPYQLIGENQETVVGKTNPESTLEYKNIQIPGDESFMQSLWKSGLGLSAEKFASRNAITAGTPGQSEDISDFKTATVDMLLKKYQDKVQYGTPSEKKSALSTIKKMFPGAERMGLIGDDGQIKSSSIFPYMKLDVSTSGDFNKFITEYEKDPLFKDDPDKLNGTIAEQVQLANMQSQTENAMITVDQYNIARVGMKMETNPGMLSHATGTEVKDFMDKYIFKQMGTINAPNSPANGAPLKAVKTEEEYKRDIYNNPNVWTVADILADAAISNAIITKENIYQSQLMNARSGSAGAGFGMGLGGMEVASTVQDIELKKNKLNPAVAQRLANKASTLLGKKVYDGFMSALSGNGVSSHPSDIGLVIDQLNAGGHNGKELLKEAFMETWTSEGRTTEWDVYTLYAENNNGQVPRIDFQEIPVIGYDKFRVEYGLAAADKNTDLQTYSPRNLIADSYRGQGGITAQPYAINFNEGIELGVATGNQDFIGLVDNLKSLNGEDRKNKSPMQRAYLLKMPYVDFLNKLGVSDDKPEDWYWNSMYVEGNHSRNNEKLMGLLTNLENELKAQSNVGNFKKLDLLEGQIKVYPVGAGVSNMTAYQITLNGEKAKAAGYQESNEDLVFTAVIPRIQASNSLYKRTQNADWVDLSLWATGKAVINVPGSGMLTITQDAANNYVINGQIYTADEINGLVSPQQIETQQASKGTIPGFLFADQLRQQLIDNYRYQAQLGVDRKAANPNLIRDPQALMN
jgi:hypothetical protein